MIRYVDDLLIVGGVPLTQFPGYEIVPQPPDVPGWPTIDGMVLRSGTDPLGPRTVRAALFGDDEAVVADPLAFVERAERSFGEPLVEGEILGDDTLIGPDRRCRVRVRIGAIERDDAVALVVVGIVVAAGTARPGVGVILDAPPHVPVERMTREIADLLSRPGSR